eukprot:1176914-Prorocentrum_minimum.AAC.7
MKSVLVHRSVRKSVKTGTAEGGVSGMVMEFPSWKSKCNPIIMAKTYDWMPMSRHQTHRSYNTQTIMDSLDGDTYPAKIKEERVKRTYARCRCVPSLSGVR